MLNNSVKTFLAAKSSNGAQVIKNTSHCDFISAASYKSVMIKYDLFL